MKGKFSSSVDESLNGRNKIVEKPKEENEERVIENENITPIIEEVQKNEEKVNSSKNKVGRPRKKEKEKKIQVTLTLRPSTVDKLNEWTEEKAKSPANYLSDYVEEKFEDIIAYFER